MNWSGAGYSLMPGHFYTQMLAGIEAAVADADFLYVMCRTPVESNDVPKFLRSRCVDGFLAMHRLDENAYQTAVRGRIPVLAVNTPASEGVPSYLFDDEYSAGQVLDRLWAAGHRRIGYVTSADVTHYSHHARVGRYINWCTEHGVPSSDLLRNGTSSP